MNKWHALKRRLKRAWFAAGMRPVLRDPPGHGFIGNFPRVVWRTPKVKGKALALKPRGYNPAMERMLRQAIRVRHARLKPVTYNLALSKRFPPIGGMRTEIYYDKPSLEELILKKPGPRVRAFLAENHLTVEQAHARALRADKELLENLSQMRMRLFMDYGADQVLVEGIDGKGRLKLILVDI